MSSNPLATRASESQYDDLYWQDEYPAITEDDDILRGIVAQADLPVLLVSLAAVLDDPSLLEVAIRPPQPPMGAYMRPHGGMDPDQQERARLIAFEALKRLRDEQINTVGRLPEKSLLEILDWFTNGRVGDDNLIGLLKHELDLTGDKGSLPEWDFEELAAGREFTALVVGAGVSGIAAAYRLKQAGIPFTWIEASHRIGGTWWKNNYPGVRLDTPTYGYSYSFAQRGDWPHQFAKGAEVLEYLETVVERGGLTDLAELETTLVRTEWDEEAGVWHAETQTADGATQVRRFNLVLTAVGQLDHPLIPEFPGQDIFAGAQMHSQEWDHSVDYRGKRVAVIGTGASAYQIVPALVDDVDKLYVFQRSAPWMLPAPPYHDPMTDTANWLHQKVPHYAQWFRLWVTQVGLDGRIHTVTAEESWDGAPTSVSRANDEFRREIIERLGHQFEGRPELLEKAIPSYPPGAKRLLRDNGVWARALKSPQTSVVLSPVHHFTENGIVTQDGQHLDVDIVVYATGFHPSDYLDPIQVVGRGGVEIHDYWGGDAKGFGGITVPGFPNLFILMGPNTGGVVAGSLLFMIERAIEYALDAVRVVLENDAKAVDLTQEALDRFVEWVDAENYRMAWGQPYVKTWYKNRFNRVSQVWPFKVTEYWRVTEGIVEDDYELLK